MRKLILALFLGACSFSAYSQNQFFSNSPKGLVFQTIGTAKVVDGNIKPNNDLVKTKTNIIVDSHSIMIDSELFKYKLKIIDSQVGSAEEGSTFNCVDYKTNNKVKIIFFPFRKENKVLISMYVPDEGEILVFRTFIEQ